MQLKLAVIQLSFLRIFKVSLHHSCADNNVISLNSTSTFSCHQQLLFLKSLLCCYIAAALSPIKPTNAPPPKKKGKMISSSTKGKTAQKPVSLVLLLLTNQLAGFLARIPFHFAYILLSSFPCK